MPKHDVAMYGIRSMHPVAGWRVELTRRGVALRGYFSVARYGDDATALAAAQAWRDEMALRTPGETKAQASRKLRVNNTSGRSGMYRIERHRQRKAGPARVHFFWMARSPEGMRPSRSRSFAVARYGEQRAYELAVLAHEAFVRELSGYNLPMVPTALHPALPTDGAGDEALEMAHASPAATGQRAGRVRKPRRPMPAAARV